MRLRNYPSRPRRRGDTGSRCQFDGRYRPVLLSILRYSPQRRPGGAANGICRSSHVPEVQGVGVLYLNDGSGNHHCEDYQEDEESSSKQESGAAHSNVQSIIIYSLIVCVRASGFYLSFRETYPDLASISCAPAACSQCWSRRRVRYMGVDVTIHEVARVHEVTELTAVRFCRCYPQYG
jgi:hypothetical protein